MRSGGASERSGTAAGGASTARAGVGMAGPELVVPDVRLEDGPSTYDWGVVRLNAGLRLGYVFGPSIP